MPTKKKRPKTTRKKVATTPVAGATRRQRGTLVKGRRSKFEQRISKELEDDGIEYTYETYSYEYSEPLRKNQAECANCGSTDLVRTGWYTPDFFLGNGCIIETKGRFTAADRRKMIAVKEAHPDADIKMLFMRDNKIHKNSSTYYSDWCMKHGYDFAIGTYDKEWVHATSKDTD